MAVLFTAREKTRFDLEEDIMKCWSIIDDLKLYQTNYYSWDEDDRMNYLAGMVVKYDTLFNTMFETFEACIKGKEFKDKLPLTEYPNDSDNL